MTMTTLMMRSLVCLAVLEAATAYCGTTGYGGPCCNADGKPLCLDGSVWEGTSGEKFADAAAAEKSCGEKKCPPGMAQSSGTGNPLTCTGECSPGCEQTAVKGGIDAAKASFEASDQMTYTGCDVKKQEYNYKVGSTKTSAALGRNGNANKIDTGFGCVEKDGKNHYMLIAMGRPLGAKDAKAGWEGLKEGKTDDVLMMCTVLEGGSGGGGGDSAADAAQASALPSFVALTLGTLLLAVARA